VREDVQGEDWEIWSEGYSATGEHSLAVFHGTVNAGTFREACDIAFGGETIYNSKSLTLWGCRLFDNEQNARESFG
jgi:hypothetical protein